MLIYERVRDYPPPLVLPHTRFARGGRRTLKRARLAAGAQF